MMCFQSVIERLLQEHRCAEVFPSQSRCSENEQTPLSTELAPQDKGTKCTFEKNVSSLFTLREWSGLVARPVKASASYCIIIGELEMLPW